MRERERGRRREGEIKRERNLKGERERGRKREGER